MKKNVWIMNHYAGSMFFDKGGRHYNFAKYLRRSGYEPVIFCANSKHGQQKLFFDNNELCHEHIAEEIATPFVFVKTRAYLGNGKQRVLNMVDFYRNVKKVAKQYAKEHATPDIIYASSVHPLTLIAGIQLAKYFGVKCICEIRDLWPESIVTYSSRLTKGNPLIQPLYLGEKQIYKKADALIFTMEGAYDYIVEQGWEKEIPRSKVHYINNGVDLETFHYNRDHFPVDDPDLNNPEQFNVVYTGSIRKVNNLRLLLDAAKKTKNPKIKFLIWGDGDERSALEQRVQDEGISNVVFKGKAEKKYIPSIVSQADLNLLHTEMSTIFRYGTSNNKLFEYIAAGKPILGTFDVSHSILEKYDCGWDKDLSDPLAFCNEVEQFFKLPKDRIQELGAHTSEAAEQYDFCSLTKKLIEILEKV